MIWRANDDWLLNRFTVRNYLYSCWLSRDILYRRSHRQLIRKHYLMRKTSNAFYVTGLDTSLHRPILPLLLSLIRTNKLLDLFHETLIIHELNCILFFITNVRNKIPFLLLKKHHNATSSYSAWLLISKRLIKSELATRDVLEFLYV